MIKNIIFDVGGVINQWDIRTLSSKFTTDENEIKFIIDNIYDSPEWALNSLFDKGLLEHEDFVKIVQDRTNHEKDELVENFIMNYYKYFHISSEVVSLMNNLKNKGYKVYVLSNISKYIIDKTNAFETYLNNLDGYVLSYLEHQVKPQDDIYYTLLDRYNLLPEESLFIDDNENNIKTANKLGIKGRKVTPNSYKDILSILKDYNVM